MSDKRSSNKPFDDCQLPSETGDFSHESLSQLEAEAAALELNDLRALQPQAPDIDLHRMAFEAGRLSAQQDQQREISGRYASRIWSHPAWAVASAGLTAALILVAMFPLISPPVPSEIAERSAPGPHFEQEQGDNDAPMAAKATVADTSAQPPSVDIPQITEPIVSTNRTAVSSHYTWELLSSFMAEPTLSDTYAQSSFSRRERLIRQLNSGNLLESAPATDRFVSFGESEVEDANPSASASPPPITLGHWWRSSSPGQFNDL